MILTRDGKEITAIYRQDGSEIEEVKDANGRLVYLASREITGTLPLSFSGRGKPLTDYLISGNTVQNGTPTPEAPVDVVGCGVWDETQQSYKLPLTVNGTEYPIYLGQTQTTRRIKKLVLTGEEVITGVHESRTAGVYCASMRFSDCGATDIIDYDKIMATITYPYFVCSHLKMKKTPSSADAWYDISEGEIGANSYSPVPALSYHNLYFIFCIPGCATRQDFQNYFAVQYAAGTPVTVWYVLATPKTAVVNEPLHKIGDYGDTISFAQAGVTIPTVSGANVLGMTSPVKPSEVYIRGKGIKQNGG